MNDFHLDPTNDWRIILKMSPQVEIKKILKKSVMI